MNFNLENFNKTVIAPALLILTGVSTFYFTQLSSKLKFESAKMDTLQLSLKNAQLELDNYIKREQFDRQLKFDLFKEIKEAIESKNVTRQKVMLVFVDQMLANDSVMRQRFMRVLETAGSEDVREEAKNIQKTVVQYYEEEKIMAKDNKEDIKNKTRVDIFYLEETEVISKPIALDVEALFINNEKYSIRVRTLPRSINARPGYQIASNQIRVEQTEIELGEEIKKLVDNSFELEKPKLKTVRNKTPNYISIFISNK